MTAVAEPKSKPRKKAATVTSSSEVPAKPPAQPGDKRYDWMQEYPGEDVFVYTTKDGKTTVGIAAVSPTRRFKPGELRKARHLNQVDQMFFVLERVMSTAALAVSDEFDDSDYGRMFEQWSEWANTSSGES